MSTTHTSDPLRTRRRLAEEWLMESSSWRNDLDDIQAQRLMNQARSYVNTKIAETALLPDEDAEEIIDEAVTAVLRVLRRINRLTPTLSQLDEASAQQQLQSLSDDLESISLSPISDSAHILAQRQTWDAQTTFDILYQYLIPQLAADTTEEEE